MNLQLNSPYRPCPYQCPFCCAGFVGNKSLFQENGQDAFCFVNPHAYVMRLNRLLLSRSFDTVVITGGTEPTLFPEWIRAVRHILDLRQCDSVEVITRNTSYRGDPDLSVVAYSFDKIPDRVILSKAQTTRAVFILNDALTIDSIIDYHERAGGQTTVKNMAKNSYGNDEINAWIEQHRVNLSAEDISRLENAGIRYDHDCNNSAGRYMIFRADGNLYESWGSRKPVEI